MRQVLVSPFTVTGKLKDLTTKSKNTIKTLKLVTEQEEYQIKVAKEIRTKLSKKLQTGCSIRVSGIRKYKIKKGKFKYKAYDIEILDKPVTQAKNSSNIPLVEDQPALESFPHSPTTKPKAKVLFCKKSTCWKGGGKTACEALKAQLQSRGIADSVAIKTVGCLKQCKKAPNIVVMPDKVRYSKVKAKQMASVIEEHLLADRSSR